MREASKILASTHVYEEDANTENETNPAGQIITRWRDGHEMAVNRKSTDQRILSVLL